MKLNSSRVHVLEVTPYFSGHTESQQSKKRRAGRCPPRARLTAVINLEYSMRCAFLKRKPPSPSRFTVQETRHGLSATFVTVIYLF